MCFWETLHSVNCKRDTNMSSSMENDGTAEASTLPGNGKSFWYPDVYGSVSYVCVRKNNNNNKRFHIEPERIMQFHCRALKFVHCTLFECIYAIEKYPTPAW